MRTLTAEELATQQRVISVSEFFAKNRHLLGFDNPRKAILTTVKEAVDNAADAAEEAGIVPEIWIEIKRESQTPDMSAPKGEKEVSERSEAHEDATAPKGKVSTGRRRDRTERFRVVVRDNGPGIVREQIPKIFGKLLYGSKFHRMRSARGQQGIGISAAALYGQLTTGKACRILSKTRRGEKAHLFEVRINTKTNEPEILRDESVRWKHHRGVEVSIDLEGIWVKGSKSVEEYLRLMSGANPHITIHFQGPDGETLTFDRQERKNPPLGKEIKPHPHGVELGRLLEMLQGTRARNLATFLRKEFCRVGGTVARSICTAAGLSPTMSPKDVVRNQCDRLYKAIQETKISNPPLDCLSPIGEDSLRKGIEAITKAPICVAVSRSPSVYRGNPFLVEAAIAYGTQNRTESDEPAELIRYANKVPLLYQQSACAMFRACTDVSWRAYGISQPKGGLPVGPLTIMIHIASVWVPFTSEAKEAVASYPEIIREIRLALMECGRRIGQLLKRGKREEEAKRKKDYIKTFVPHIAQGLQDLLDLSDGKRREIEKRLVGRLSATRVSSI